MRFLSLLLLLPLVLCAQHPDTDEEKPPDNTKLSFWFNLGYQYLGPSGSNSQYEAGSNDFPVTPGHDAAHVRFLVGYRFLPRTEILTDLTIYSTSMVTKISHYLSLSLGMDQTHTDPFTTGTKLGYQYVSEVPERSTDVYAAMGIGTQLRFDYMLKAFIDLRLMSIFDSDGVVFALSISIGVGFYF